jgi:hypothetical protein
MDKRSRQGEGEGEKRRKRKKSDRDGVSTKVQLRKLGMNEEETSNGTTRLKREEPKVEKRPKSLKRNIADVTSSVVEGSSRREGENAKVPKIKFKKRKKKLQQCPSLETEVEREREEEDLSEQRQSEGGNKEQLRVARELAALVIREAKARKAAKAAKKAAKRSAENATAEICASCDIITGISNAASKGHHKKCKVMRKKEKDMKREMKRLARLKAIGVAESASIFSMPHEDIGATHANIANETGDRLCNEPDKLIAEEIFRENKESQNSLAELIVNKYGPTESISIIRTPPCAPYSLLPKLWASVRVKIGPYCTHTSIDIQLALLSYAVKEGHDGIFASLS